jgi:hypothetical protein
MAAEEKPRRKPDKRSHSAQVFLALVLISVLGSTARIVSDFSQDSADHDLQALHLDVLLTSITGGVILLVIGSIGLGLIPGEHRLNSLRATFPASVVVTGRWNPEFGEYVLANYLAGLRWPNQIRGIAFTVVGDSSGIHIWGGVRRPRELTILPWSEIERVSLGSKAISAIRTVSTIDIQLKTRPDTLQFAVGSKGWAGAFPAGDDAVSVVVDELAALHRDPTSTPERTLG